MAEKEDGHARQGQWVLLEALGFPEHPMSILAIDGKVKSWTSPSRTIGTQALEVAQKTFHQVAAGEAPDEPVVWEVSANRKAVLYPIAGPMGPPHGFHVWVGPPTQDPGAPPRAAGYTWDAEKFGVHETFECANMSGTTREDFHAFRALSDFTRRAVMFRDTMELAQFGMQPKPGNTFLTTLSVLHIQTGQVMPWIMALKATSPVTANGLFYDQTTLGVAPELPGAEELGLLQMAEELEKYMALVNLVPAQDGPRMVLGTWITSPPPWVRYDRSPGGGGGESYIHPEDRAAFVADWAPEALSRPIPAPGAGLPQLSPAHPVRLAGWNDDEWVTTSSKFRPYTLGGSVVSGLFIMEVSQVRE